MYRIGKKTSKELKYVGSFLSSAYLIVYLGRASSIHLILYLSVFSTLDLEHVLDHARGLLTQAVM